jgi:hypothetical protein
MHFELFNTQNWIGLGLEAIGLLTIVGSKEYSGGNRVAMFLIGAGVSALMLWR